MEFKVFQKELELQSRGWIPTFHDVSKEIREIVAASGVKNGTVCRDPSGWSRWKAIEQIIASAKKCPTNPNQFKK